MTVFFISAILIGLCVLGMCFNIIFKKDGKFPDGEISHNKELKKRGLQCAKAEERILWSKKKKNSNDCSDNGHDACDNCSLGNCDNIKE